MSCSKFVCKYKMKESSRCLKDMENAKVPKKCNKHIDEYNFLVCRHGNLFCKNCKHYAWCEET